MSADRLLERLEAVRRYRGGWRARCPCCGGRRRDHLSITEADGGRTLLHCFAGCTPLEVVHAVGLTLADLFPEPLPHDTPEARKRAWLAAREAGWGAALRCLDDEAFVVHCAARHLAGGETPLGPKDRARLQLACRRIEQARAVLAEPWRPKPWRE